MTLVVSFATNAQEVRVIDNKGTIETIRNNSVTTSNTAPTNPVEGDIWYDTSGTTTVTKTYDGTDWIANFSNVYVGFFIIDNTTLTTTGTYSQDIRTLPFEPSQITFTAQPNLRGFDINNNSGTGNNTNRLDNTFGNMHGFARANGANIDQAVIFSGGSGSSINNISRYSNDAQCIGIRYTNNNGNNLGVISAVVDTFETDGFDLNITYTIGTNGGNLDVRNDVLDESLIVMFTAYR
ncbi:hypothetical protein [Winogradskyella haliclonae]|uniref:hypothetical protein n=1 Tax=Winogradskyella haliclonae TaxID=2048558 RepID=UPI00166B17A5|nr:hypothetical protein [Winogradskyella haliclonae]